MRHSVTDAFGPGKLDADDHQDIAAQLSPAFGRDNLAIRHGSNRSTEFSGVRRCYC
jgi:hypothetical protein